MLLAVASPKIASLIEAGSKPAGTAVRGAPLAGGEPLSVDAIIVAPGELLETVMTTGTLLAQEQVELQAEASGRITAIDFREGGRVAAGQLLVKLTDADLQAARAATQREHALALQRERRSAELLAEGFVRQEDYDLALSQLEVLEASLALTEAQIARTEIRAPFDGIAGLRYVSEGAVVSPQTRIATLQNTDSLKLEFAVPEKYADRIRPGTRIYFSVAGSDESFEASIYARDPRIDPATRTLTARALSSNADGRLLPGAFANVRIVLGTRDDALLIPAAALIPDIDGAYVLVAADGRAERRQVDVGLRTQARVEIAGGIEPGDIVITSGLLQLEPGMRVAVSLPPDASAGREAPLDPAAPRSGDAPAGSMAQHEPVAGPGS